MAIAQLQICEWRGTRRTDRIVRYPSFAEVAAAVQALDGKLRNDLYLRARADAPAPWLSVGGGSGRYLVTGAADDETFPTLVDRKRERVPEESLCVGGQIGLYPGHWVHALGPTLQAVEYFWRTGTFGGSDLDWDES